MTTALAIIAVLVSLGALGVAIWQGNSNRRSAAAAEGAEITAQQSVDIARQSELHAKASAEAAQQVAKAEIERDHDRLAPDLGQATWDQYREPFDPADWRHLYVFRASRAYAVQVTGVWADGSTVGLVTEPPLGQIQSGSEVRVHVGAEGKVGLPDSLLLRFWPAQDGPPSSRWGCPCDRPSSPGGPAHWKQEVRLPKDLRYDVKDSLG